MEISLNGLIYCTGGHYNGPELKTVVCYDPIINQWTQIAPMENSRRNHGTCKRLRVVDGIGMLSESLNSSPRRYSIPIRPLLHSLVKSTIITATLLLILSVEKFESNWAILRLPSHVKILKTETDLIDSYEA
uniref:Uncharacterized protein n=1 Tax=Glossina brevipalpis TaxID=37001 RepID=A0A1A9WXQ8_9MUSC